MPLNGDRFGCEWILQDHFGQYLHANMSCYIGLLPSLVVEAIAIWEAFSQLKNMGIDGIHLKSHVLTVVQSHSSSICDNTQAV